MTVGGVSVQTGGDLGADLHGPHGPGGGFPGGEHGDQLRPAPDPRSIHPPHRPHGQGRQAGGRGHALHGVGHPSSAQHRQRDAAVGLRRAGLDARHQTGGLIERQRFTYHSHDLNAPLFVMLLLLRCR